MDERLINLLIFHIRISIKPKNKRVDLAIIRQRVLHGIVYLCLSQIFVP
jgi:hypothetical protein